MIATLLRFCKLHPEVFRQKSPVYHQMLNANEKENSIFFLVVKLVYVLGKHAERNPFNIDTLLII